MKEFLLRNLHGDVEGTCSGRVGYIICVLTVTNISPGKVLPGSGLAEFVVQYQAIVFKPYKGEVVDAIVTSVNQVCSLCSGDAGCSKFCHTTWRL
jgi:DNA-directed RNA polymerase II subunit RPB7